MNGHGTETATALSVAAVIAGTYALLVGPRWLTVVAWILLVAALVALVADRTSPDLAVASCAVGVAIVGAAGAVVGYFIGSNELALAGFAISVLAFVVAVGEMWGAA